MLGKVKGHILGTLLVRSRGILDEASVLNGDSVAGHGSGTGALLVSSLGNAHDCFGIG